MAAHTTVSHNMGWASRFSLRHIHKQATNRGQSSDTCACWPLCGWWRSQRGHRNCHQPPAVCVMCPACLQVHWPWQSDTHKHTYTTHTHTPHTHTHTYTHKYHKRCKIWKGLPRKQHVNKLNTHKMQTIYIFIESQSQKKKNSVHKIKKTAGRNIYIFNSLPT